VKEECSFLKKRTKKLLSLCARFRRIAPQQSKVFCFFFSKKKAFLLFFLFSPCAHAADKFTVILDWFIDTNHAALFAAQYCGDYAAQGLDVSILPPADPDSPPRLVAAGQADLAVSYQTQLNMMDDHGLGLVRVATLVNRPLNTVMALGASGIRTMEDLKGRKIGVSVGGVEEALLGAMLKDHHLSLEDVTVVKVNFQMLPALMSRQLDAAIGAYRNYEVIQAQMMGGKPVVFTPEANGVPPFDELILVAAHDKLGDPRIKRFLTALKQGAACLAAHPDTVWADLIKDHPEMDTALNKAAWAATLPLLAPDPAVLDAKRYEVFQDFLVQQGIVAKALPIDQFAVQLAP
jgi:putative hydroxymethylpyrimidine transport system substrate-binding protein